MSGIRFSRPGTPMVAAICLGVLVALAAIVVGVDAGDKRQPTAAGHTVDPSGEQGTDIEFMPVEEGAPTPDPTADPLPQPSTSNRPGTTPGPTRTGGPAPTQPGTPPPSRTPGPVPTTSGPPKQTYSGITGYHCGQDATRGFTRLNRWLEDDLTGWYSVSKGAWTSDGCDGAFDTMPMNGSASAVDYKYYAEWWFKVGSASKTCDLSTYMPKPLRDIDVRGNPAYYEIRDASGTIHAVRSIQQASNQSRWVSLGTHTVHAGKIVVRIRNTGTDPKNEHIAIAATRAVCHG